MAKQERVLTKEEIKAKKLKEKEAKKANKKPSKIATVVKETGSELKKVSWPSFATVRKKTLVVLGVVICFAVVIFVLDLGLSELYKLLTKGL
ncbi:MAG: preprotein translocase subunit SecE [Firmicutes bacterium]|nr:preprotein translocase subunit SecE [Bacillota bacterium]